MSSISIRPEQARDILNRLIGLNQRQEAAFSRLNQYIAKMSSDWSGDIASAASERLSRTNVVSTTITEEMNVYTDALAFAIRELEEADRRAAEQKAKEEAAKNAVNNPGGSSNIPASSGKSTLRWGDIPTNEIQTDSFNGVPSYVNQRNFEAARDGTYYDVGFTGGERNCAEYVKRYYMTIHKMNITGLTPSGSPSGLVQISSPNPGDVIRTVVGGTVHWAIVKEVKNGMAVVIEQNTVYKSGSEYALSVNNSYPVNGNRFYTRP